MNLIKDILAWIFSLIKDAADFLLSRFLELRLFNKLLLGTLILAFLATVKPSARYYIFESWYYVNNPLSSSLIGIALLIIIGFFIKPIIALVLRVIPSALYFAWVIYLQVTHSISKAPYELTLWHYLNMFVPVLIVVFSLLAYFNSEDS